MAALSPNFLSQRSFNFMRTIRSPPECIKVSLRNLDCSSDIENKGPKYAAASHGLNGERDFLTESPPVELSYPCFLCSIDVIIFPLSGIVLEFEGRGRVLAWKLEMEID